MYARERSERMIVYMGDYIDSLRAWDHARMNECEQRDDGRRVPCQGVRLKLGQYLNGVAQPPNKGTRRILSACV
jgi:hypothetical protein